MKISDIIRDLYESFEDDIREESGKLRKTGDGIEFHYPEDPKGYRITITAINPEDIKAEYQNRLEDYQDVDTNS